MIEEATKEVIKSGCQIIDMFAAGDGQEYHEYNLYAVRQIVLTLHTVPVFMAQI